jgi:16S rRNA (guanine527-N7)-methyltransferase
MIDLAKKYFECITGPEFSGLNLTAMKTFEEVYNKQFVDSLLPLVKSEFLAKLKISEYQIIDLGFGGGIPLLILAHHYKDQIIYGVDARAKKADAVNIIAKQIGLNNVKAIHGRLEEIYFDKPSILTFKAVGKISEMLDSIRGNTRVICCFYKGPNVEELEDINAGLHWTLCEDISYDLPGQSGRRFLIYQQNVPRGTKANKQMSLSGFAAR